jgi:small subunit ribosomal protein S6
MFLVDSALAASDWDGINAAIKKILKKAKVKVLYMKKWDERKLAYDIKRVSRGTYILCYFKAPGSVIHQIERDVQLSEKIVRALILRADHISEKDIEQQIPSPSSEQQDRQVPIETAVPQASEKTIAEQEIPDFSFDEDLEQPDQPEDVPDDETDITDEQEKIQ